MNLRNSSLDSFTIEDWRWQIFLNHTIRAFSKFDLKPCQFDGQFLEKEALSGSKSRPVSVVIRTWACSTDKLIKVRAACLKAGNSTSVFNLVAIPECNYEIPFFGADFVTLPSGHLIALDLQPMIQNERTHRNYFLDRLIPIYDQWKDEFPHGGDFPDEVKKFFSEGFIWTKLPLDDNSEKIIDNKLMLVFSQYLDLYIDLVIQAKKVGEFRVDKLIEGQKLYLEYRAQKDPARAMLTRFFGSKWTENYIHNVLFTST